MEKQDPTLLDQPPLGGVEADAEKIAAARQELVTSLRCEQIEDVGHYGISKLLNGNH